MTVQEKLRKTEQQNRRLEARIQAAEKRNKYLLSLYERFEQERKGEAEVLRTRCDLLTMLLDRVAIAVGEITIPTENMKEEIMGYEITFDAMPQTHEIRIKAVKKEQG